MSFSDDTVDVRLKPFGPCEGNKETCMFKERCPMEGNLYVKGKDQKLRIRNCKDAVSRGRGNRRDGLKGQSKGAKFAGVPKTHSLRPGNEEHWAGRVRYEFKEGAQIQPALTAFDKCEKQSEASRSHGDNRPFVAGFVGKKSADGVVFAFRSHSDQETIDVLVAWAEQFGLRFES